MPTIRAVIPATFRFDLELTRDFDLSKEYQVAKALYERLIQMDEHEAIDYLVAAILAVGEGRPRQ